MSNLRILTLSGITSFACGMTIGINLAVTFPKEEPKVIYVTNTVTTIREVPAPPIPFMPTYPPTTGIITNWGPFVSGPFVETNGMIVVPNGGAK